MVRVKTIYKRFCKVASVVLLVVIIYTRVFSKRNSDLFDKSESLLVNEAEDSRQLSDYPSSTAVVPVQGHGLDVGRLYTMQFPLFVDGKDAAGPGEGGVAVEFNETNLSSEINKTRYKDEWAQHGFNVFVSEMISIHRSLPDCRSDVCKERVKQFNGALPEFSVVIIFNNEAWTTLLRSVHSVLSRSPEHLLKEVVLVDDNSELGWADSMLIRIAKNPQTVVFPIIEAISDRDFGVRCNSHIEYYCTFLWKSLDFHWVPIPKRELDRRQNDADSFRSPIMPGGIFAIGREFFTRLGKYDPGLGYWGGENIELSFKAWMCGGSLEMDPCSRVGHVFRKFGVAKGNVSVIFTNAVRVAEVWMDDYKNYFYEMNNYRNINPGNVADRLILRQSLQCSSFAWYLKNLFPEKSFSHGMKYAGEIRSAAFTKCIDSKVEHNNVPDRPILIDCSGFGRNQVWYMGAVGQIFQEDLHLIYICIVHGSVKHSTKECQPPGPPYWDYRKDKSLYHIPTGQCLTADNTANNVFISVCTNSTLQKWHFQERRTDLIFPNYK